MLCSSMESATIGNRIMFSAESDFVMENMQTKDNCLKNYRIKRQKRNLIERK